MWLELGGSPVVLADERAASSANGQSHDLAGTIRFAFLASGMASSSLLDDLQPRAYLFNFFAKRPKTFLPA